MFLSYHVPALSKSSRWSCGFEVPLKSAITLFLVALRGDAHMTFTFRGWDKNKMLLYVGDGEREGLASVLDFWRSSFSFFFNYYQIKLDLGNDQTSSWVKHQYIIDKKSSYWLWYRAVKPSFNNTIAFFVA